jgi:hypothetical protein
MKSYRKLSYIALALPILIFGCAGDDGLNGDTGAQGPEGPGGPEGPEGPGFPAYSYVGDNAMSCVGCHDATVEAWQGTGHADALASLVASGTDNNPYCLKCHTTGFDAPVAYGDTVLTDHGADDSGYDDYWPAQDEYDTARLTALKDVQCEACHGSMGPTIYNHDPDMSFATRIVDEESMSICGSCHHSQIEEWESSGHGAALEHAGITIEEYSDEFNSFSTCWECHTSEGFIQWQDDDWAGMARPETASLIGCVTCHDPHSNANEHQLRGMGDVAINYDVNEAAVFTGQGASQLCAQCHHARRDNDNVQGQIDNGYAHFGPHGSPQTDLFLGSGSYEIEGFTYDRDHVHNTLSNACVSCHMEQIEVHDRDHMVHNLQATVTPCQGCHPGLEDFDYNGGVTEINDLMTELENAIGIPIDSLGGGLESTPELRAAGYAYVFVANDGSHGIHNPTYTKSLLQNAIDSLNP